MLLGITGWHYFQVGDDSGATARLRREADSEAEINMYYLPKQGLWAISESSEAIKFSGCDYDGNSLTIGRFYFQTDQLIDKAIWPKREAFLQRADRVFQMTRKLLERSKDLDAYVGKDAAAWEPKRGRFQHL